MNNLLAESRLSLKELSRREGISLSTAWRWTLRGVRGITLESYSLGSKRVTTDEAFCRFVNATTTAAQNCNRSEIKGSTRRQQEAAIKRAEAELAKDGL
ncbi:MAG: DUF1580 domain-containing protein [Pirellulales bacterium]|nr:DUF1580 domain-containing protein [Pirellulales bacterium]